jgi:hypothetical protein
MCQEGGMPARSEEHSVLQRTRTLSFKLLIVLRHASRSPPLPTFLVKSDLIYEYDNRRKSMVVPRSPGQDTGTGAVAPQGNIAFGR